MKRLTLNNHFQARSKQRPEAIKVRGAGLPMQRCRIKHLTAGGACYAGGGGGMQALATLLGPECRLTRLSLANCNLKQDAAEVIDALSGNKSLEHLDISGNGIGDKGVYALAKGAATPCTWGRGLLPARPNLVPSMSGCMRAECAAALQVNTTLTSLAFDRSGATPAAFYAFSLALARNRTLQSLSLPLDDLSACYKRTSGGA